MTILFDHLIVSDNIFKMCCFCLLDGSHCQGEGFKIDPHPSVCTHTYFPNWFQFTSFNLPQPNLMKLIHNAIAMKTQIKFWLCQFYCFGVMSLYKVEFNFSHHLCQMDTFSIYCAHLNSCGENGTSGDLSLCCMSVRSC